MFDEEGKNEKGGVNAAWEMRTPISPMVTTGAWCLSSSLEQEIIGYNMNDQ
jgi:hypothetical protein